MAPRAPASSRLVYSTGSAGGGSRGAAVAPPVCRRCGAAPCRCEPVRSLPAGEQRVTVRRERAGRGGKTVTVVGPLVLTRADAADLLAAWKRLCGGGGTLRTSRLPGGDACFEAELQGDHADRLTAELLQAGYRAKRAGG
jgi:translation initiation factor 1